MKYVYGPLIKSLFIFNIFPAQFYELVLLGIWEIGGQNSVSLDGKQDQHTSKSPAVHHVKEVGKAKEKKKRNGHWAR